MCHNRYLSYNALNARQCVFRNYKVSHTIPFTLVKLDSVNEQLLNEECIYVLTTVPQNNTLRKNILDTPWKQKNDCPFTLLPNSWKHIFFFVVFIIFYLLIQYTFNIQTFNLHPIHEFKTYTMKHLLTFTYIYIYIYIT